MNNTRRSAGAAACTALFAVAAQAQTEATRLWRHEGSPGEPGWTAPAVSIGARGTQVFAHVPGAGAHTRLLSSHDVDPATAVWDGPAVADALLGGVDSARDADVHVALRFVRPSASAARTPVFERYSSGSPSPEQTWDAGAPVGSPRGGAWVAADGGAALAWFERESTQRVQFARFDAGAATPAAQKSYYAGGPVRAFEVAEEPGLALIVSDARTVVHDLATNQPRLEVANATSSGGGHALAGDGSVLVRSWDQGAVELRRAAGATFEPWTILSTGAYSSCTAAALSHDGGVLALGVADLQTGLAPRVLVYDLSGAPALEFEDVLQGVGTWEHTVVEVALTADGRRLVVGLTGDEAREAPQLVAYERDAQGAWIQSYGTTLGGSVVDLDLAPDGRCAVVSLLDDHVATSPMGGRVDLFDLGGRDLVVRGKPRPGATVEVRHHVPPGAVSRILWAPERLDPPQTFGALGVLHLARGRTRVAGAGPADAEGVLSADVTLPGGAAWVGRKLYLQGMQMAPTRGFSETFVELTVLPY